MTTTSLLHDFQRFPDDELDATALYRTVLEQAAFVDEAGFDSIAFPEHHGAVHGYLPAPIVAAAAVAGRTSRVRLALSAVIAPLHDPLRLAEDLAVLDLASDGRVDLTIGAGYVPAEFAMFGADLDDRPAAVEAAVAVLRQAWTGQEFDHRGVTVRVTPTPAQQPHPPIVLGGSSPGAARRAARIGDGFRPSTPELWATYRAERIALGHADPGEPPAGGPFFLHIADDPDAAKARIGAAVLRGANQYLELAAISTGGEPFVAPDVDTVAAFGMATFVDPAGAVELARALGPSAALVVQPRFGGVPVDEGWSSLELFVNTVMPALHTATSTTGGTSR